MCQDEASARPARATVAGTSLVVLTLRAGAGASSAADLLCQCRSMPVPQAMQYMQDKMDGTLDEAVLASRGTGSRTRRTASSASMDSPGRRSRGPPGSPVVHHPTQVSATQVSAARVRGDDSGAATGAQPATTGSGDGGAAVAGSAGDVVADATSAPGEAGSGGGSGDGDGGGSGGAEGANGGANSEGNAAAAPQTEAAASAAPS